MTSAGIKEGAATTTTTTMYLCMHSYYFVPLCTTTTMYYAMHYARKRIYACVYSATLQTSPHEDAGRHQGAIPCVIPMLLACAHP